MKKRHHAEKKRLKHYSPCGHLKEPPSSYRAQAAKPLLAPLIISTSFRKIRYQKIADFAERCCFFCRKTAWFAADREISEKFSVFHKIAAAFLDRIRGPPSEI
ncbi:MAG: hypothetical protein SPI81_05655 [Candidatus Faecousia sp.]|nr:hypothetical protein [Candidatus Faecousia sp.]